MPTQQEAIGLARAQRLIEGCQRAATNLHEPGTPAFRTVLIGALEGAIKDLCVAATRPLIPGGTELTLQLGDKSVWDVQVRSVDGEIQEWAVHTDAELSQYLTPAVLAELEAQVDLQRVNRRFPVAA